MRLAKGRSFWKFYGVGSRLPARSVRSLSATSRRSPSGGLGTHGIGFAKPSLRTLQPLKRALVASGDRSAPTEPAGENDETFTVALRKLSPYTTRVWILPKKESQPPVLPEALAFPFWGQAVPMMVIFSAERPVCSMTTSCTMSPSLSCNSPETTTVHWPSAM